MKYVIVRSSQLGDDWTAEHHIAQQEGTRMTSEEERLTDKLNQVLARYAELKHAAAQVTRLWVWGGQLREHELNLAIQELQACIDAPLVIPREEE